ncbi:MAG: dihydrolipoamide acetyltransferase family protein [Anaerolineales bacterium]
MAKPVIMPRFGMTQEDATIVKWLVKEGDRVDPDDPLAEVTTDKVNMEVPAPAKGIVGGIRYSEGETVPVTRVIAYILQEGESAPEHDPEPEPETPAAEAKPAAAEPVPAVKASPLARKVAQKEGVPLTDLSGSGPDGRITRQDVESYLAAQAPAAPAASGTLRATPAARRAAREQSLTLAALQGSGPRGRIQEADVMAAARAATGAPGFERPVLVNSEPVLIPLEGLRKTIADRMQASAQNAPHITFDVQADMTRAMEFRIFANERAPQGLNVSMTALLVKIVAASLRRHRGMNAFMREDGILLMPNVNVGVAVAIDEGLIVPVIHDADLKSLYQIAYEVKDQSERARSGRLMPDDVAGGTFTISNLGMFGIDRFTAIINPPQVGILAVGKTETRFVPDADGSPVARPMMTLTLSADHRALDGAQAARFLADVRDSISEPASIML